MRIIFNLVNMSIIHKELQNYKKMFIARLPEKDGIMDNCLPGFGFSKSIIDT